MIRAIWHFLWALGIALASTAAGTAPTAAATPFVECMATEKNESRCFQRYGRYNWHPPKKEDCNTIKTTMETAAERKLQQSWQNLFKNERCARLGHPHFEQPAQ